MRVIKGGVWKNVEDEILKAAVMKYGKNQWARIASLLARKSAKQCKARWFEYLDPSIKKTEWTREEEEKLLHMAKIMPCQWRTIAPIVGRTSSQCLEHYEKLLDAATEGTMYDPKDDPRKLRPGEIDPNPESKPPRQDHVDLEEDEKEMLQEARARLANTKGKKAKRKAREKQLEEARRLAALQKRRELKAAGIQPMQVRPQKKKKPGMSDYNKEVPFLRNVPTGFYSTSSEKAKEWKSKQNPNFTPILLQKLEGNRRDEVEDNKRKLDIKKLKERIDKDAPTPQKRSNLPDYIRRRAKLIMPEPQISDQEINMISNMGYSAEDGGSEATRMLVSDYLPTPTPQRGSGYQATPNRTTERTPLRPDTITMEAQNLRALSQSSTPLLPGDDPELHTINPEMRRMDMRTPNPLLTPLRGAEYNDQGTSRADGATPMRDSMNINPEDYIGDIREERLKLQNQKENMRRAFSSLPEPTREISIAMPDVPDDLENFIGDGTTGTSTFLVDADDIDRKALLAAQKRKEKKLNLKSQVMNKNLPRPFRVNSTFAKSETELKKMEDGRTLLDISAEMIKAEMIKVITNDALTYPTSNARPPKINKKTWVFEQYTDTEMGKAKKLLDQETKLLEKLHGPIAFEEYTETWERCNEDLVYVPQKNAFNLNSASMSLTDRLDSMEYIYDTVNQDIKRQSQKVAKLEQKLSITQGGYGRKIAILEKEIADFHTEIDNKAVELDCYSALAQSEEWAIPIRIEDINNHLERARNLERDAQNRFSVANGNLPNKFL